MPYTSITIEGGMFPPDMFDRIAAGELDGQQATDFGLKRSDRLSDEIQSAFSDVRAYWDSFQRRAGHSSERITSLTREFWMIPVLERLGYRGNLGLLYQQAAIPAGGDTFVISHRAGEDPLAPPVHIAALGQDLGKKPERTRRSPHATVQEFLNRTDALWGIVTNGEKLRLLRNSVRISRPTYVEFDLRGIIEGNLYNEFIVLYRLLHRSRFPQSATDAAECRLERYYQQGIEDGGRVQENLRVGVETALETLGTAFLSHPKNQHLRDAVASDRPDADQYYRELLRLIYRMLFLFVAEERGLLLAPNAESSLLPDVEEGPGVKAESGPTGASAPTDAHPSPSIGRGARGEGTFSIYIRYYGLTRLRSRCERPYRGDRYSDLWTGLVQTFRLFRYSEHAAQLGLTALNGELFGTDACKNLENASCANEDLLEALFHLSTFYDERARVRRRVNYAGLDVEELGSVYESLLDYKPHIELDAPARFALTAGGERKQTGSYYTPPSLVAELISSALEPVIEERLKTAEKSSSLSGLGEGSGVRADSLGADAPVGPRNATGSNLSPTDQAKRDALLSLRVVDPASGSGHFLLAAARRIAREVARIESGEPEPPPEVYRHALREVIRQCIYAVDKNPLAVDLCKVALWLEGHEPGKPLSFLDHHVKHGDSLIGVMDLDTLEEGIPNDAYKRQDRAEHRAGDHIRKRNQAELKGQRSMFQQTVPVTDGTDEIAQEMDRLRYQQQTSPDDVEAVTRAYQRIRSQETNWYRYWTAANLWTAAFFADLSDGADALVPTTDTVRQALNGEPVDDRIINQAFELSVTVPFFHWPLEFPDVFDNGGFDVVLGNPPWERIKLQEKEFFAGRDSDIANAPNKAARQRLIDRLPETNPMLHRDFQHALFESEAASRFVRSSGRFPFSGVGDVNTYALFTELTRELEATTGSAGIIIQSDLLVAFTYREFLADLLAQRQIVSAHDFVNTEGIFPGIHRTHPHFCLLTLRGSAVECPATFSFWNTRADHLRDSDRHFELTADELQLLNPNTRTLPIFRTSRDAEITKAIYRRVPVLVDENRGDAGNPWGVSFLRMIDMSNDSGLFRTREGLEEQGYRLEGNIFVRDATHPSPGSGGEAGSEGSDRYLPLYEAKMIHQFDHRWATYDTDGKTRDLAIEEKADPTFQPLPRYWVAETEVAGRLAGRWDHEWLLGWRDITNSTNERTVISAPIPQSGCGDTFLLMFPNDELSHVIPSLAGNLTCFALDYPARQKIGGTHLKYHVFKQLPILSPHCYQECAQWDPGQTVAEFIQPRVLELTYTAWDMQPFARDCGYHGPPFRWDEERRFLLRCELDAAFFHLYGIERDDVDYIMETFPIVKRKDIAAHGEYRTKRVILEIYDAMSHAIQTGIPYQTRLTPPPADPGAAHESEHGHKPEHVRYWGDNNQ